MTKNDIAIALDKLSVKDNEAVVVKFRTNGCVIDDVSEFISAIKNILPCPVVAIPENVELQSGDIDEIINYLQAMKKS